MAADVGKIGIGSAEQATKTFFQGLMEDQDFPDNPQTQEKVRNLVNQYYKALAQLASVQENELTERHFEAITALFRGRELSDKQRNIILGAILAADILRILSKEPNATPVRWFVMHDKSAYLSKHLISSLINPQDPNVVKNVVSIIDAAFCDPKVLRKYSAIGMTDFVEKISWTSCLNSIFRKDEEAEENNLSENDSGNIVAQVMEHIAEKKPKESPLSANFLLNACGPQNLDDPGQGVLWGSLVFLVGLMLVLSAPVTAIPSFGLSVAPSLGVGGAMMVVGGVAAMTGLGFFGRAKQDPDSPSTAEKPARWFW